MREPHRMGPAGGLAQLRGPEPQSKGWIERVESPMEGKVNGQIPTAELSGHVNDCGAT